MGGAILLEEGVCIMHGFYAICHLVRREVILRISDGVGHNQRDGDVPDSVRAGLEP